MSSFSAATHQLYSSQVLDALSLVQCRVLWERGQNDGRAVGNSFFDGNTTEETYRAILKGIEDGDPAIIDQLPYTRIGDEYADEPTWDQIVYEELSVDISNTDMDDVDWLEAYESGFRSACEDEITNAARGQVTHYDLERLSNEND